MAVKTGTQILYNLLLKEAVKGSGQASGIMSIGDSVRKLADKKLQSYLLSAQKQGVDLDKLGEQEIRYMLEMNKPKAPKAISADSPEGRGITEALFGKRGQVIEAKFGKPFAEELKKFRGPVKEKKDMGPLGRDIDVEVNYSASLDKPEFFGANAKNIYGETAATGSEFIKKERERILNTINRKNKEMVPTTHSNYKLLKKSLQDQEDALEAIKITEDLGGNENMFDFLRTQNIADYKSKPLKRSNYVKTDDPEDFADGGRTGFDDGGLGFKTNNALNQKSLDLFGVLFNFLDDKQRKIVTKRVGNADGGRIGFAEGNGVYDEDVAKKKFAERVRRLIDEGYDFGEAVKQAMKEEGFADGGVAGLLGERTGFRGGGAYRGGGSRKSKSKSKSATPSGGGGRNPMAQFTSGKKPSQKAKQALQKQRQGAQQTIARQAQAAAAGQGPFASSFAPTQTKQGIGKAIANFAINRAANAAGFPTEDLNKVLAIKGLLGNIKSGLGNLIFSPAGAAEMTVEEMIEQERKRKGKDTTPTTDAVKAIPDLTDPQVMSDIAVKSKLPTETKKFKLGDDFFKTKLDYPTSDAAYSIKEIQGFKRPENPVDKLTAPEIVDYFGTGGKYRGMDLPQVQSIYDMVKVPGQTPFMAAQGGRVPFAMGRRAFLKLLGVGGAGIAGLKTGVGLGGKKIATEVAKDVATTSATTPPPYFFNLVNKIKTLGDDAVATQDKAIAKKYKDYTMEEDFAGNIEIIKKGGDDMFPEDVYMSYKVDEVPLRGRGKKKSTKVEEYEEYTARPDQEGKIKDVELGVPDEVVNEGTMFEDNMTDFGKADGGIARMLGE